MTIKTVHGKHVVVPENVLDREILQHLLVWMKPDDVTYWNVKTRNAPDPLDSEDRDGRILVVWGMADGEQNFDPFSLFKDGNGNLFVGKAPMPPKAD
jgi:hypothetical protein